MKYNKAIRDKIPDIIKNDGHIPKTKVLSDDEFLKEMEKKLTEEVKEFQESNNVSELVDILEVVYKISELHGIGKDQLDKIRSDKAQKRGKFEKNLFLIETDDKN